MRLITILLMIAVIFVIGCSKVECPECEECPAPDECPVTECPALDCDDCPAKTEEVKVEVIKYVCEDNSTVDSADKCHLPPPATGLVPITTNEEGTYIEVSSVEPACREGVISGESYFKSGRLAQTFDIQVKESNTDFSTVYSHKGIFQRYSYFRICDDCTHNDDFTLKPGHVYLLRIKFSYDGKTELSNEHLIDLRQGSDFMKKEC